MYILPSRMNEPLTTITRETQVAWHVRIKEYLASKMWYCAACNASMKLANMSNHKKTKKHQLREAVAAAEG
jgi:hypothetical protein